MHAKLTANLIAKRSEERNKKTGKEEGVSQNLSEMDYLKVFHNLIFFTFPIGISPKTG